MKRHWKHCYRTGGAPSSMRVNVDLLSDLHLHSGPSSCQKGRCRRTDRPNCLCRLSPHLQHNLAGPGSSDISDTVVCVGSKHLFQDLMGTFDIAPGKKAADPAYQVFKGGFYGIQYGMYGIGYVIHAFYHKMIYRSCNSK